MSPQGAAGAETLRYTLAGLERPAEILVDRWGIPHLRAESRRDLFFVQGFNAARDRLWQLDLWRKRGLGLLAADFGPGYLEQDRLSRLCLYRGDMAAEWRAYGVPDAEAVCEAFTAGLNAYIGLTEKEPALLPEEFARMGTRPARWVAADVVRIRSHALVANADSELLRARVLAEADARTDRLRERIEPEWEIQVPEGGTRLAIPDEVIDAVGLIRANVQFAASRLAATLEEARRWRRVDDLGAVVDIGDGEGEGSNNWAVAPARSATGRPILASDPHRNHAVPSLRYLVHLTAPGIDAIGAGEPCLPGISIGHNGTAAFGLTIFPIDQEDIYVYELDPGDPDRYRYAGGWERMRVERESFAVKGAPAQEIALKFTRHGPVLHQDHAARRAFALRSVWSEPGSAPYLGSLAYLGARAAGDFAQAMQHWGTPPVNHVYADSGGNIAWITAGRTPRRPNWDGLLPVPGDGRYEWDGFHRPEELPREINPQRGFVATANEMNLPDGYPFAERKLSFEWSEKSRAVRIKEALAAQPRHGLEDAMALQCDALSIPARRLLVLLAALQEQGDDSAQALRMLLGWDCRLERDSAAAALFEVWWMRHLKPGLLARLAGNVKLLKLLSPGDAGSLLAVLENPEGWPQLASAKARDAVLVQTLAAAFADCRARLGRDPAGWAWGRLHHGYFEHALSPVDPERKSLRDVGPLPVGGSGSTPMNMTYRLSDGRVTSGATFRMVVDVGNWDNSRVITAPGQSGAPSSRHYRDLAPVWAEGRYVPFLFSRAAVDAAVEQRILLEPAA